MTTPLSTAQAAQATQATQTAALSGAGTQSTHATGPTQTQAQPALAVAAAAHADQAGLHQGAQGGGSRQDPGTQGQGSQAALDAGSALAGTRAVPGAAFALAGPRVAVPLARAAQAVQETITLAARPGASTARIQLSPESLGPIDIHLQRTADGVVARVLAGPEAAEHFQQGADDLRRSLLASGINLVSLHIETSGGGDSSPQTQAQAQAPFARRPGAASDADDIESSSPNATAVLPTAPGSSINVLA